MSRASPCAVLAALALALAAAQRTEQLRTAPGHRDLIGGAEDILHRDSTTADAACLARPAQSASIRLAGVARHLAVTGEAAITWTPVTRRHELANG